MSGRIGLVSGPALLAASLALVGALALPSVAEARTSVVVGVGIGPVMPAYPHHHHPHYYPPVVVAPPPVVLYEPGPPVVFARPPFAQAPVVQAPVQANPAGPVYMSRGGQLCREYQSTIMIGGVPQPSYGTACQQPDGSWRIVN